MYKTKEREAMRSARENQAFKAQEKVYQNVSKRKARENPYILECERIKKQQIRQEKRKFNDNVEINVPRKRCKHDTDTLPKTCHKDFVTIGNCLLNNFICLLNNFIQIYLLDPYMFVHVVTKHGLGKVFQCLRILIFLQKVEDNIAQVLHLSIMKNGLVIHA